MRINQSIVVRAPRQAVWQEITDPAAYLDFMSGITRWELQGDGDVVERPGQLEMGSRIRMLIQVGSAEVGGLIEVVEYKDCSDLAWSSAPGSTSAAAGASATRAADSSGSSFATPTGSPGPGSPACSPSGSRHRSCAVDCARR